MDKQDLNMLLTAVAAAQLDDIQNRLVNKLLVPRGLVCWVGNVPVVTEKGRQFLFQSCCKAALQALCMNQNPALEPEVEAWLRKHEFVIQIERKPQAWKVTPRGQEWLAQIE